jgi:hypothetical protein
MAEDDKSLGLLQEVAATFDGTEISVTLGGRAQPADLEGGFRADIKRRGGKRHPVRLYPVRGALGLAVVDRIGAAAASARAPVVVVAAVVGKELRTALVEHGLGYLDLAGNCHLELDAGNVTVHVEGKRRTARPVGSGGLRAAGYQVLFALLADESLLARTVREVAEVANVSRHAAHSMAARLRDEGLLVRAGRSEHVFAPGGRETCIDRFALGWADVLRGRLLAGRFRLREPEPGAVIAAVERSFHAAKVPFGFGGAHGSSRWVRHLQSAETVVHTAAFGPELVRALGAIPDRNGPLYVFRTMTARDLAADRTDTAHPLLVYAELARSAEPRAREAAGLLLEQLVPGSR